MGLDISAFRKVEPAPDVDLDKEEGPYCWLYANTAFPGREAPLTTGVHKYEDTMGFAAGAYSSYNRWREDLAKLVGYPAVPYHHGYKPDEMSHAAGAWLQAGGPFWELINFSDCEGVIGHLHSGKLAVEFGQYQEQADKHESANFRELYALFRSAFEMASDGGAVVFR
jgi:hypothetical protein